MKILLLEDDIMLNRSITKYLQTTGHEIRTTRDGNSCLEILNDERFDLLILDVNVPNISGFKVLEKLYELNKSTPTIFISALIDIEDISKAFELGCYDYLKKPFHLKELTLRINKVIQNNPTKTITSKQLSNSYTFNLNSLSLTYNNEVQSLTKRQIQIIKLLTRYKNSVVNFDKFREVVWNEDIDNATIRAEINRLKKVLQEDFITNVRGIGYMIEYQKEKI
jgi:DNA-binding response OmpR family regulator